MTHSKKPSGICRDCPAVLENTSGNKQRCTRCANIHASKRDSYARRVRRGDGRTVGGSPKRMWEAMARFIKPDLVTKERPVTMAYELVGHHHKGVRD